MSLCRSLGLSIYPPPSPHPSSSPVHQAVLTDALTHGPAKASQVNQKTAGSSLLEITGATGKKKKAHFYLGSRVTRSSKETTLFGFHFVQRFCASAYCRKTKALKTIIPQRISAEVLSNPNLKSFGHLTQGKCLHSEFL